jgi:hypothetical protein
MPIWPACRYIKRRAKEGFAESQSITDAAALEQLWQRAKEELEVVKRQAVVYGLYARKHKSVMVGGTPSALALCAPEPPLARAYNLWPVGWVCIGVWWAVCMLGRAGFLMGLC